jgi:hypothetical protein
MLQEQWMPTADEKAARFDFAWNVIIPELLTVLYCKHFGFDKDEAEYRLDNTFVPRPR